MLGKRHRPAMKRTTSMSQLGACSGIENSPPSESCREEKQRAPYPIALQSRVPSPPISNGLGNSIPILKNKNGPRGMNPNEGNNQPPPVDSFLKGMAPELAVPYPAQPFMGQGQFSSVHVGVKSFVNPMGSREGHPLTRAETFPQAANPWGHGAQMVEPAHFLQACFLCKHRLGYGRDIYMYRDDRAFCSVECRHQQIVLDERKEKRLIKVMMAGSVPFEHHQNFDKNVKSGAIENVQSKTGATT